MRSRLLTTMMAGALLLGACASTDVKMPAGSLLPEVHASVPAEVTARLAQAPVCCDSLAQLPYEDWPAGKEWMSVRIDEHRPAFEFEGGKNWFAAFRLPAAGRPLVLDLASRYVSQFPGDFLLQLETAPLLLRPVVLILDERFQVRRVKSAARASKDDPYCPRGKGTDLFPMRIQIDEPPPEAAYLVITTTDALRARTGEKVCGVVREGFSPVGEVQLRLQGLAVDDGRITLMAWTEWTGPGAKEAGFWEYLIDESPRGYLTLGSSELHFVPERPSATLRRFDVPLARVVSAAAVDRKLIVGVADEATGGIAKHQFWCLFSDVAQPDPIGCARSFAAALDERIRRDAHVDRIGIAVAPWEPRVEFVARIEQAPGATAAQNRILDKAMTAGIVTAFPCGLCQTGVCPPQALVACAALFAAGAAIGGTAGIIEELSRGGFTLAPAPAPAPAQADAALGEQRRAAAAPVSAVAQGRFDQPALQRCVMKHWDAAAGEGWRDQGRSAVLVSTPHAANGAQTPAPDGLNRVEVALSAISLTAVAEEQPDAQLVFDGQVRLVDPAGKSVAERKLAWQTPTIALERLVEADPAQLREVLDDACDGIGREAVRLAMEMWRYQ